MPLFTLKLGSTTHSRVGVEFGMGGCGEDSAGGLVLEDGGGVGEARADFNDLALKQDGHAQRSSRDVCDMQIG